MVTYAHRIGVAFLIVVITAFLVSCTSVMDHWVETRKADSISAYRLFLAKYPMTQHTKQAQYRLELLTLERDWQVARDANSIDGFEVFLRNHKKSKYNTEATTKLQFLNEERDENIDWLSAIASNSSEPFSLFLKKHPNGRHAIDASEKIDELMFANLLTNPTLDGVEAYLRENKKPRNVEKAIALARTLLNNDWRLPVIRKRIKDNIRRLVKESAGKTVIPTVWVLETSRSSYAAFRDHQGAVRLIDANGTASEKRTVSEVILKEFPDHIPVVLMINRGEAVSDSFNVNKFLGKILDLVAADYNLDSYKVRLSIFGLEECPTIGTTNILCRWIAPLEVSMRDVVYGNDESRNSAILCLGALRDKSAIPILGKALLNEKSNIRKAASKSILEIQGSEGYAKLSDGGDEALCALFELLWKKDSSELDKFVSENILKTIRGFGSAALPHLVKFLATRGPSWQLHPFDQKYQRNLLKLLQERNQEEIAAIIEPFLLNNDDGPRAAKILEFDYVANSAPKRLQMKYFITTNNLRKIDNNWSEFESLIYEEADGGRSPHIEVVFKTLIQLGRLDSIAVLKGLLEGCSNVSAAQLFLNCGNDELEAAARQWANKRGYSINKGSVHSYAEWGALQKINKK